MLGSYIERWLRGRVPDALDILITPTIALLVSGLTTSYLLMVVANKIFARLGTDPTGHRPGGQLYSIFVYLSGLAIGYVAGFIVTWFFGFTTELLAEHNQVEEE